MSCRHCTPPKLFLLLLFGPHRFGVDVGVDYYALSFVRNAEVIYELKNWLATQGEVIRWAHTR